MPSEPREHINKSVSYEEFLYLNQVEARAIKLSGEIKTTGAVYLYGSMPPGMRIPENVGSNGDAFVGAGGYVSGVGVQKQVEILDLMFETSKTTDISKVWLLDKLDTACLAVGRNDAGGMCLVYRCSVPGWDIARHRDGEYVLGPDGSHTWRRGNRRGRYVEMGISVSVELGNRLLDEVRKTPELIDKLMWTTFSENLQTHKDFPLERYQMQKLQISDRQGGKKEEILFKYSPVGEAPILK